MNKLITAFATLILSSSLAKILSQFLVSSGWVNLFNSPFSKEIPSFSPALGLAKTFDILNFGIFMVLVVLISFLNVFVSFGKFKKQFVVDVFYLLFAVLLFLQSHFVRFSGKDAIFYALIVQGSYLLIKKLDLNLPRFSNWIVTANGFLMGFYLMFFVRQFTTSLLWVVGILILSIFVYQVLVLRFRWRFFSNPLHLLLIGGIFFPWNKPILLVWISLVVALLFYTKSRHFLLKGDLGLIYSLAFLFLAAYDPLFYFGNLDSIEEGIWLGWLQRLISGQVLYRDVALYHPPLIVWGMDLFVRIFGNSVYFVRLYFHILRLMGIFIFFWVVKSLLKSKLNVFLTTVILLSFTSNLVRNNVEIRVGVGLVALFLFWQSLKKEKALLIFCSGMVAALALALSIEVGIAATIGCLLGILISSPKLKNIFQKMTIWLLGFFLPLSVIFLKLAKDGALYQSLSQILFYARAFSAGYFNLAQSNLESISMLQWWRVNRFLGSTIFIWEIAAMSMGIGLIYLLNRFREGEFLERDKLLGMILIYSLVLSRSALGRSDWYHLLFMLVTSFIILIYVIESLETSFKIKYITIGFWVMFYFVFSRDLVQEVFLNRQVFKIQSYANVSQRYQEFNTDRAKIALDIDAPAKETNDLIDFLKENVGQSDKIFAYPWKPEIYYLSEKNNATSFDTPYAFFTREYQEKMIRELKDNKPKYIIYNPDMNFGGMTAGSLSVVQSYIISNYSKVANFGKEIVMEPTPH